MEKQNMYVTIGEKTYLLSKAVMPNDAMRKEFNKLAEKTFRLSFESWYQSGYWSPLNMPYTLFDGEKAVANCSVNHMELLWNGQIHRYIQLGTVMTDEAYRRQGLSRFLMNEIMKDWKENCDGMFLFANHTVLDFYPKFGFQKETQYQFGKSMGRTADRNPGMPTERTAGGKTEKKTGSVRKLDIDSSQDLELLKSRYENGNPFSRLQAVNGFGLLMFYAGSFMKDCIYYLPEYDAVVIAEQNGTVMYCYDIFCKENREFMGILMAIAGEETEYVTLKFTPEDGYGFEAVLIQDDDDTLFVLKDKENIFRKEPLFFPEISHT